MQQIPIYNTLKRNCFRVKGINKKECIVVTPSIEPILYSKPYNRITNNYYDLNKTKKRCAIKFDYMVILLPLESIKITMF